MDFYLAPLEGMTKLRFRNAFYKYFPNINKMYIPFIEPTSLRKFTIKETKEMDKDKNRDTFNILVPQIISKNASDSLFLINQAKEYGYREVNLNFGCPSPTVTTKGKGSGMLKDLVHLDNYLKEIFDNVDGIAISIKMRIGFYNEDEFISLIKIINKYNVSELIIHPRTALEKYGGYPHLNIMDNIDKLTNIPIIYNGDIKSKKDIEYIKNRYPYLKGVMLGRGLIYKPFLLSDYNEEELRKILKDFYFEIANKSIDELGWGNAKYYLKELWSMLQRSFVIDSSLAKKPFKQEKEDEFFKYINEIMDNSSINFDDELSYSFTL